MRLWEELAWQTNLSPAECISKIRAYTATDTIGRFLGLRIPRSGTLLSAFDGPGFRLLAVGSVFLRNSADSYFYGTVSEVQGRTLIHGSFRLHPLTLAALVWVLACALVIGLVFFILGVAQLVGAAHPKEGEFPTWLGLTLLPQMLLGGVTLTALSWRWGRPQRQCVQAFIETTLQAQRVPLTVMDRTLFKAGLDAP